MPPVLRDSCGPEGRTKTSWPPSDFRQTSRQDAGVELACPTAECEPQDAASGGARSGRPGRHSDLVFTVIARVGSPHAGSASIPLDTGRVRYIWQPPDDAVVPRRAEEK